ncbi:MAG: sporulation protein YqfD [Bacilli bacterium]|nr:sporulation protein YqfD [Bacilli bacterium]
MIEKLKSKVLLSIKGKNINRFIKKLITKKINILYLKYIDSHEVLILIYKNDYEKVLKLKTIYNVLEKDTFGLIKIKKSLKLNSHLIIIAVICIIFFYILTNLIFNVEIIHSNKEIRTLIRRELKENGIKKYTFKKSYKEKEKIKEKILNKYPDKIEWLEIIEEGTKYKVRIEEREIIKTKENNKPRNIVAKKDAVIKKVVADKGVIERNADEYVKKGDIVINGDIILNEKTKGKVRANGRVYGEVWYIIRANYPFVYSEEKKTGKSKDVYVIKYLNKDIELTLHKFKTKKIKENIIFHSQLLPIKLVKQTQNETKVKKWILTFDAALLKGKELMIQKMQKKLNKNEYIIRSKYLKSSANNSTIDIEMFFALYEDITDYKEIE